MLAKVKLELHENIATITLNRPEKKNALTFEMLQSLSEIGDTLKKYKALRCIIIRGAGGAFSSGIDITSFSFLASDKAFLQSIMTPIRGKPYNKMQKPCMIWSEIAVPVIAALEGPVFGAGLQLALGADIRIAAPSAVLSVMETKWGLIPDMGISQYLPKLVNYDQALLATLTAKLIDASEAKNMGLVTICSKKPYLHSLTLAKELLNKSPDATMSAKKLYKESWFEKNATTLKLEAILQTKLIGSPNQMEAVLANIEKRNPHFGIGESLNVKQ